MRREMFERGEFYHIYDRGVNKAPIFINQREKQRFINTFYVQNNFETIPPRFNLFTLEPRDYLIPRKKPYVEVAGGCIMDNHYHFLLTPVIDNGISLLFQRLGTSFTMYYNKIHERTGHLFEGPFRAKHVDKPEYGSYLAQYIHLNPVAMYQARPGTDRDAVMKKIEKYEWSSLSDYIGKKSKLTLLLPNNHPRFRDEVLGLSAQHYQELIREYFYSTQN